MPAHPIGIVSPRGPLHRYRGGIGEKTLRYAPHTLATPATLD